MQREVWARLTSPFPSEALAWNVVELEEGDVVRARLEPAWSQDEVRARLDAQLGLAGWSYALSAAGAAGVVCTLTIEGTSRAAAAGARAPSVPLGTPSVPLGTPSVPLEALAELAFSRCARQFGIAPQVAVADESYWVDFDPEAGEPIYFPEPVPAPAGAPGASGAGAPQAGAPAQPAPAAEPAAGPAAPAGATEGGGAEREASSEALAMIERLVDRLKAEGLGREAARLVALHHGDTAEDARELYSRLRALLLKKDAE